ncbi:MAG: hypothetical protein ABSF60_01180 [Verrucomicrobiota bacterium]|jgi:hypothetical protein
MKLNFDLKPAPTGLSPVAGGCSISEFLSLLAGFGHCGHALPALAPSQAGGDKQSPANVTPSIGGTRLFCGATRLISGLFFTKNGLDSPHQNRHLRKILGRARLDSDAGTDDRPLWRQHIVR